MEQLRDIKGLVDITLSPLWLIVGGVILVLLLGFTLYKLYQYFQRKKAHSIREKALLSLTQMEFHDAKKAAYLFTQNGYLALKENALHVKTYEAIMHDLEAYKYKREVPALSEAMIERMKAFISEVNHG